MIPLFVYGGASTGKTSTVLYMLRHLKRPFIYCSCVSCYSPSILFESILNQILLHRKNESGGYLSAKRCERPSDFVNLLGEALTALIDSLNGNMGKSSPNGRMVYLVFDRLELVRECDKSDSIIPLLFNLYTLLSCSVLSQFYRITRRVDELSTAFSPLFKKYCEPLGDLVAVSNEDMERKLYRHLQPFISSSQNETFTISSQPLLKDRNLRKCVFKKSGVCETLDEIDFHMSTSAKYLLISAFLASRNPATLDASLFDSTGGTDNRKKKKRKVSEKSVDQKEAKEQEILMKGPGTFPLERLLAIPQCIASVGGYSLDNEELQNDGLRSDGSDSGSMSDILLQLSSLCRVPILLPKVESCPLEGSTRYRSIVSEDIVLKVARSLNSDDSEFDFTLKSLGLNGGLTFVCCCNPFALKKVKL
ncbi:hypothetical protein SASPL_102638 [Salvia splendens]|uniref:Origin recognition complex subunit 5 n=1 Tax=Salvia splendens TaxID=180675 RepID=A0A8X9AD20_SALSN|nr:hypothetical protein SASPL_102638 [Salvia splendens]